MQQLSKQCDGAVAGSWPSVVLWLSWHIVLWILTLLLAAYFWGVTLILVASSLALRRRR